MASIDQFTHPYGLGGVVYLSGSARASGFFYSYYPFRGTPVARIVMSNMSNPAAPANNFLTGSFSPGIAIYGTITQVTQSSGEALLMVAQRDINDR